MKTVIVNLIFTCVVIFNSIQLSSQSNPPKDFNPNAEENETFHGVYHESPNIREGHIGTPRSSSFQRRLEAYQQELARVGQNIPAPYVPRRPPSPRRPNEEFYSVPPTSDGVFHNVYNRPAEVIDNYLDSKPKSGSELSRTKSGSVNESGSGSGSKSKGKWWSKSKNTQ